MQVASTLRAINATPGSVVVRIDSEIRTFVKYPSWDVFLRAYDAVDPKSRFVHEIIPDGPQRFHLDIDGKDEFALRYGRQIIEHIHTRLCELYLANGLDPSFVVYITPQDNKLSCHMVDLKYYLQDSYSCIEVCNALVPTLDPRVVDYLDVGIYKTLHSLRMPLSAKYRVGVAKVQLHPRTQVRLQDCLITKVDNATLTVVFNKRIDVDEYAGISKPTMSVDDVIDRYAAMQCKAILASVSSSIIKYCDTNVNDTKVRKLVNEAVARAYNSLTSDTLGAGSRSTGSGSDTPAEFLEMLLDDTYWEDSSLVRPNTERLRTTFRGLHFYRDRDDKMVCYVEDSNRKSVQFMGAKKLEDMREILSKPLDRVREEHKLT